MEEIEVEGAAIEARISWLFKMTAMRQMSVISRHVRRDKMRQTLRNLWTRGISDRLGEAVDYRREMASEFDYMEHRLLQKSALVESAERRLQDAEARIQIEANRQDAVVVKQALRMIQDEEAMHTERTKWHAETTRWRHAAASQHMAHIIGGMIRSEQASVLYSLKLETTRGFFITQRTQALIRRSDVFLKLVGGVFDRIRREPLTRSLNAWKSNIIWFSLSGKARKKLNDKQIVIEKANGFLLAELAEKKEELNAALFLTTVAAATEQKQKLDVEKAKERELASALDRKAKELEVAQRRIIELEKDLVRQEYEEKALHKALAERDSELQQMLEKVQGMLLKKEESEREAARARTEQTNQIELRRSEIQTSLQEMERQLKEADEEAIELRATITDNNLVQNDAAAELRRANRDLKHDIVGLELAAEEAAQASEGKLQERAAELAAAERQTHQLELQLETKADEVMAKVTERRDIELEEMVGMVQALGAQLEEKQEEVAAAVRATEAAEGTANRALEERLVHEADRVRDTLAGKEDEVARMRHAVSSLEAFSQEREEKLQGSLTLMQAELAKEKQTTRELQDRVHKKDGAVVMASAELEASRRDLNDMATEHTEIEAILRGREAELKESLAETDQLQRTGRELETQLEAEKNDKQEMLDYMTDRVQGIQDQTHQVVANRDAELVRMEHAMKKMKLDRELARFESQNEESPEGREAEAEDKMHRRITELEKELRKKEAEMEDAVSSMSQAWDEEVEASRQKLLDEKAEAARVLVEKEEEKATALAEQAGQREEQAEEHLAALERMSEEHAESMAELSTLKDAEIASMLIEASCVEQELASKDRWVKHLSVANEREREDATSTLSGMETAMSQKKAMMEDMVAEQEVDLEAMGRTMSLVEQKLIEAQEEAREHQRCVEDFSEKDETTRLALAERNEELIKRDEELTKAHHTLLTLEEKVQRVESELAASASRAKAQLAEHERALEEQEAGHTRGKTAMAKTITALEERLEEKEMEMDKAIKHVLRESAERTGEQELTVTRSKLEAEKAMQKMVDDCEVISRDLTKLVAGRDQDITALEKSLSFMETKLKDKDDELARVMDHFQKNLKLKEADLAGAKQSIWELQTEAAELRVALHTQWGGGSETENLKGPVVVPDPKPSPLGRNRPAAARSTSTLQGLDAESEEAFAGPSAVDTARRVLGFR